MAKQGKPQDGDYVIEDDIQKGRLQAVLDWLKTGRGKVTAVFAAAAVLGGGTAIAGMAGSQVAKDLPVDTAHHYVFDPNLDKGYRWSMDSSYVGNPTRNPFSGGSKRKPWISHGPNESSKPKHVVPLGPPIPESEPGGNGNSKPKPNPKPTKR